MYSIETNNLSYRFSAGEPVLRHINLQVPQGAIYGFLGPNGAGKTTTLRLILGLLRRQEGSINILGASLDTDRVNILRKTGTLIESPSIYTHLTATENLRILQLVYQCPKSRIAEVLRIAGLQHAGSKKTGKFSLGMKQRLSIAMALLHQPSLLILDEPTNGLDPEGIIEMRELLKRLNQEEGMTIVISSHLLPEVEKLATHTGIIHKGQLLFQGTLADLRKQQELAAATCFITSDNARAVDIIKSAGLTPAVAGEGILVPCTDRVVIGQLTQQLLSAHISIYQVSTQSHDLESIFIDLVKN